jgi:signal transduction histidine kinase/CheY-like chemotaxis protein
MDEVTPATTQLDAKYLGQLLLMQSVLDSIPDAQSIRSFVTRGLLAMPGVAEACIRDVSGEPPAQGAVCFPLQVGEAHQGELLVACNDPSSFRPYEDYIRNFCFMVAVILEERQHRQILESHQIELEQRVQERTSELKILNATLEQRVAERTAEAQWRANQLQRLAAQMTQAEERERRRLAQFLHDHLQQLLVAVKLKLGSTELKIQGARAASAVAEAVNLVDEAIRDSRSITAELSPPVLYDGGLAAALEWLGRETEKRYRLSVAVQADPELDPDELTTKIFVFQVARELILNVVKHARASSLRICLSKLSDERLQLMVEDDGVGFDPEVINQRKGDGGFGLFSIRERLEVIGGQLTIASTAVEGTKAMIVVPCARTRQAKRPEGATDISPLPAVLVPVHTHRVRVLLADDHPVLRKGLSETLMEHPDINVVGGAKDGQEAIEMALQLRPDVVLMDISMPRADGIEATRQIKRAIPEVSVIGLSMHETEEMVATIRNAGATEYLTKTTPVEDLLSAILRLHPAPNR